jgi:hypothetical protein
VCNVYFKGIQGRDIISGSIRFFREKTLFSDIASLRRIVRNNKTAGKLLCFVAVPLNMSIAQLCQFLEPYFKFIMSLRAVREVNSKVRYMLLIEMKNAEKAEELYLEYNGKPFSSLEVLICFYVRLERSLYFSLFIVI